jgi:uncharacterized membrane protein YeaQ/YmgE (transglycosylase-associated protein family)
MSGTLINLIIQIVAGALGGNAAGAVSKDMSLGTAGNTIAGAIGGGVGGQILTALLPMLSNAAGREFWFRNREFSRSNPKSSPDKVFGTHRATYP